MGEQDIVGSLLAEEYTELGHIGEECALHAGVRIHEQDADLFFNG